MSEPNYHMTEWFSENLIVIEMNYIRIKIDKPIYLSLSILEISKTTLHEIWYDYIKPKDNDKANLCCMDTDKKLI